MLFSLRFVHGIATQTMSPSSDTVAAVSEPPLTGMKAPVWPESQTVLRIGSHQRISNNIYGKI